MCQQIRHMSIKEEKVEDVIVELENQIEKEMNRKKPMLNEKKKSHKWTIKNLNQTILGKLDQHLLLASPVLNIKGKNWQFFLKGDHFNDNNNHCNKITLYLKNNNNECLSFYYEFHIFYYNHKGEVYKNKKSNRNGQVVNVLPMNSHLIGTILDRKQIEQDPCLLTIFFFYKLVDMNRFEQNFYLCAKSYTILLSQFNKPTYSDVLIVSKKTKINLFYLHKTILIYSSHKWKELIMKAEKINKSSVEEDDNDEKKNQVIVFSIPEEDFRIFGILFNFIYFGYNYLKSIKANDPALSLPSLLQLHSLSLSHQYDTLYLWVVILLFDFISYINIGKILFHSIMSGDTLLKDKCVKFLVEDLKNSKNSPRLLDTIYNQFSTCLEISELIEKLKLQKTNRENGNTNPNPNPNEKNTQIFKKRKLLL